MTFRNVRTIRSLHPRDVPIRIGVNGRRAQRRVGSAERIAFVLQGGGSLAAPQVGLLRALIEAGVVPDLVVGSSAGALNAVAYATDPTSPGLDRLEALWMSLRRRHVAPFSAGALVGALSGRGDGLVPASALRDLLQRSLVLSALSATVIPVHVVATQLLSGEPVVLSDGDPVEALLASCAYPGLYAPVDIDGQQLIDGGVSADTPVLQAESAGASITYVLPAAVSGIGPGMPRGPLPLALRALGQILDATARRDAALARGPVHVLPAPATTAANPVDFRDTARLIEHGYRLGSEWLADHLRSERVSAGPVAPSREHATALPGVSVG